MLNEFMVTLMILLLPFGNTVENNGNVTIKQCQTPPAITCQYMDSYLDAVYDPSDVEARTRGAMELLSNAYPDWNANYENDEFDCTEMCAYVAYYLRSCGIQSKLAIGVEPKGTAHTWLEIYIPVSGGTSTLIVESTTLAVINPLTEPDKYEYYKQYTKCDTSGLKATEFDWWNTKYFKSKYFELKNRTDYNALANYTIQ